MVGGGVRWRVFASMVSWLGRGLVSALVLAENGFLIRSSIFAYCPQRYCPTV